MRRSNSSQLEKPACAELVKLRFFAGLTQEESALALGVTRRTADRYWAYARAWLFHALDEGEGAPKSRRVILAKKMRTACRNAGPDGALVYRGSKRGVRSMSDPGAALDVMAIFNEALDQPSPSARPAAYLDRACGTTRGSGRA